MGRRNEAIETDSGSAPDEVGRKRARTDSRSAPDEMGRKLACLESGPRPLYILHHHYIITDHEHTSKCARAPRPSLAVGAAGRWCV